MRHVFVLHADIATIPGVAKRACSRPRWLAYFDDSEKHDKPLLKSQHHQTLGNTFHLDTSTQTCLS